MFEVLGTRTTSVGQQQIGDNSIETTKDRSRVGWSDWAQLLALVKAATPSVMSARSTRMKPVQTLLALVLVTGSSAICDGNTKHALFRCMMTDYEKTSRPGLDNNVCVANAPPVSVTSELVVKVLTKIDQRLGSYELEGYMRLRWRDERLAFNSSAYCQPSIVLTSATDLWVPDLYFEHSVSINLGNGHDGEVVYIYPDGSVVWSRFARLQMRCTMGFGQLPFDTQNCLFLSGIWSDTAADVLLTWYDTAAPLGSYISNFDTVAGEWTVVDVRGEDVRHAPPPKSPI